MLKTKFSDSQLLGGEGSLAIFIGLVAQLAPADSLIYGALSVIAVLIFAHWSFRASSKIKRIRHMFGRLLFSGILTTLAAVLMFFFWSIRFSAAATVPTNGSNTCPAGFIAVAKTPQSAAIRNLGGSVVSQSATGSNQIENVCVKITEQHTQSEAKANQNSPKNSTSPDIHKQPMSNTVDPSCTKSYGRFISKNNVAMGYPGYIGSPFSPPPGACVDVMIIDDNHAFDAGITQTKNSKVELQEAHGNIIQMSSSVHFSIPERTLHLKKLIEEFRSQYHPLSLEERIIGEPVSRDWLNERLKTEKADWRVSFISKYLVETRNSTIID